MALAGSYIIYREFSFFPHFKSFNISVIEKNHQFPQRMKGIEVLIISFFDNEENIEENSQNLKNKSHDIKEISFIINSIFEGLNSKILDKHRDIFKVKFDTKF